MPSPVQEFAHSTKIPVSGAAGDHLRWQETVWPDLNARLPLWAIGEAFLAFAAAAVFYVSLYGELPYHDAARFAAQVESDRFVWDIAHVLLQPVTLLWHRWLGFGESAAQSQKHIHTFAVAVAVAIFYATMVRLRIGRWERVCAVVLLIGSASLIILTPSAHMKLVTYPFLNGAIYHAVLWERRRVAGTEDGRRDLIAAAVLLAIAAAFLVSCLAAAPFVTVAACLICVLSGGGWREGIASAVKFAAICGLLFAVSIGLSFVLFSDQSLTLQGVSAAVSEKAGLGPQPMTMAVRLARTVYGTANNLVNAPVLGGTLRAWMGGEIPDLRPYYPALAGELVPWLAVLVLIGVVYLLALRGAFRGTVSLMVLAFLAGAQAWTVYYSLNDPEHWFLLSVPTILLFLTVMPAVLTRWLAPLAAILVLGANLWTTALPTTLYPLSRSQAAVARMFGGNDLLVSFAAYPGGPYLGFFELPGIGRLQLDRLLDDNATPEAFYAEVDRRILETLSHGGRVVMFGVLDPESWDAPWPNMTRRGVTKARLLEHFSSTFAVKPLGEIVGLKAWEVFPRDGATGLRK